jgi:hypothetical protein
MKQTLKKLVSPMIWQFARMTYDSIRRVPELPAAYLHPWRRESIQRLTEFKDIHKGKRAFIIGNGPSLKHTDLGRLRNEYTFGMNRIYLLFEELGFHTTYFAATKIPCVAFISSFPVVPAAFEGPNIYIHFLYRPPFFRRCTRPCMGGCHGDKCGASAGISHGF